MLCRLDGLGRNLIRTEFNYPLQIFFEASYATGTINAKLVDAFAAYDVLYTLQVRLGFR